MFLLSNPMGQSRKLHAGLPSAKPKQQNWRAHFSLIFFVGFFVCASLVPLATSQNVQEFISIDCGGTGGTDVNTDLKWVTDAGFLDSATQLVDEGVAIPALVKLNDSTARLLNNAEQLKTALAFLPGRTSRSKYCYNFTVTHADINSTSYLVRAMFPSSNLTANVPKGEDIPLNVYGTRFYFTVDSTFVSTIHLDPVDPQTVELVVTTLDQTLYICLVPLEDRSSMPAISSLEIRPLAQTMYPRAAASGQSNTGSNNGVQSTYLMLVSRLNFGGDPLTPPIRYPADGFDRLWYAPEIPEDKRSEFKSVIGSRTFKSDGNGVDLEIRAPSEVMSRAWEGLTMSSEISFTFDIDKARSFRPVATFYVNMMLLDITSKTNETKERLVDIDLDHTGPEYYSSNTWASSAKIQTNQTWRWYNYKQSFFGSDATYRILPSVDSSLPAMVNAVEVFGEFDAITERTYDLDVESVNAFSSTFSDQVDTAGDPCLPVPWDWIVCSIEIPPRISQINLTSRGLAEELQFDERFGSLNRLTLLDLSNNSFHGSLPSSVARTATLRVLNLANNNLSGELPPFREKSLSNLDSISLRYNSFNGSLQSLVKALDDPVFSLDLSMNNFSDSIPPEIGQLKNLRSLDLSYNSLSGELDRELVTLPLLKNLNLRNNNLSGVVPGEIWSTDSKLVNVDLRKNAFTEINLNYWARKVLENNSFDANQQQVSLVSNQISNIILPPQELFEPLMELMRTNSSLQDSQSNPGFILLGGNPWCDRLDRTNLSLVERYLCRSNENEEFLPLLYVDNAVNTRALIIITVSSGLLVLTMACILIIFLWRFARRMFELRQIQEALAKDDVRPPFYKYEELRSGTKDFSKQNELGKGAFGAVYKAVLADDSIVAVKRLFPTEQNVSDFLKEMVLITGIKHRHLVQLKGCCVRDKQRMLVYEYAENRNLAEALWGKYRTFDLNWKQRLNICVGIARGLSYLHEELQPKIIHRDIKPQNILLDKDWNAKIADFGLARPVEEDATQMATHVGGTLGYFSPEYATLGLFTEKLDVYSFGVLVLEIVSGRRCIDLKSPIEDEIYLRTWAFRLCREKRLVDIAAKCLLSHGDRNEIESVLKTALSCLQEDPTKRPTMSQVVSMLTGNSEVAIDIVRELKEQQRFEFDTTEPYDTITNNSLMEREERSLLYSTSSNGSAQPNIELSRMEPR